MSMSMQAISPSRSRFGCCSDCCSDGCGSCCCGSRSESANSGVLLSSSFTCVDSCQLLFCFQLLRRLFVAEWFRNYPRRNETTGMFSLHALAIDCERICVRARASLCKRNIDCAWTSVEAGCVSGSDGS